MEMLIKYTKESDNIKLVFDDASLYYTSLYDDTIANLEEDKETFSANIEVNIIIDENNKTFVAKSVLTSNTFSGGYDILDADNICYWVHEIAVMDGVIIYIECYPDEESPNTCGCN